MNMLRNTNLIRQEKSGKISALPYIIQIQIRSPWGNLVVSPLFSLCKNYMHNEVWGYVEILPENEYLCCFFLPHMFPRGSIRTGGTWGYASRITLI